MHDQRCPCFMFYERDLFMYDAWRQIALISSVMISDSCVHLLHF